MSEILFAELLASFSIDNEIWVTSRLNRYELSRILTDVQNLDKYKEGWYLKQVGGEKSDFWLVCYLFFKSSEELNIVNSLDWIAHNLSEELIPHLPERPF